MIAFKRGGTVTPKSKEIPFPTIGGKEIAQFEETDSHQVETFSLSWIFWA